MHRSNEDYQIGARLGCGAYGVVYLVTHLPTRKEYALKKIAMRNNDEGIPQRFDFD